MIQYSSVFGLFFFGVHSISLLFFCINLALAILALLCSVFQFIAAFCSLFNLISFIFVYPLILIIFSFSDFLLSFCHSCSIFPSIALLVCLSFLLPCPALKLKAALLPSSLICLCIFSDIFKCLCPHAVLECKKPTNLDSRRLI